MSLTDGGFLRYFMYLPQFSVFFELYGDERQSITDYAA